MTGEVSRQTVITVKKRRPLETLLYAVILVVSIGVVGLTAFLIVYILIQGIPAISVKFLTTAENPILKTVGIFPSIVNTLYMVLFTLLISVPLGVGGAIYLNEYAKNRRLVGAIEFATETLSGIPSILYGVFGYVFFCVLLRLNVSLIAGVLTLSIMVLPILMRTTQETLKAVPQSYREGALGMGATKWHLIRTILLPCSLKGILTGVILSIGRMVSESAALLLVAGGSAMYMPRGNLFEQMSHSGSTLSVELYRYAMSRGDNKTAFGIAAILIIIVIALNLLTRFLAGRLNR
ncbi:MAG: phosphate ABC transporter permease PstA [Clostridiales Family XIII bacterium]|jgi:phosphate transport system permease protein|nr:phosphate ABC transporter permease PstA [Clostridiales Family XIII bacterium]